MRIRSAGQTDTGLRRKNNEDFFLVDDTLGLYLVADGIGGHAGGEIASRVASETLREQVNHFSGQMPRGDAPRVLLAALRAANAKVADTAAGNPELLGMGTTLTALVLTENRAHLVHVGDSRAYLFKNGSLKQISQDDSVVGEQIRAGLITPEDAKKSPYRHIITKALGIDPDLQVMIPEIEIQQHDTFLLCSDGLTGMLEDREIETILAGAEPDAACQGLINAANKRGGVDNITVVVITIDDLQ